MLPKPEHLKVPEDQTPSPEVWIKTGIEWLSWFSGTIMPKLHDGMKKTEIQDIILDMMNELSRETYGTRKTTDSEASGAGT